MRSVNLLAALGILAFITNGAQASVCREPRHILLGVDVREAPIVMMSDITTEQLRSASERLGRTPAHPVFGFYAGTVGFALPKVTPPEDGPVDGSGCPDMRLTVELVVVDRRIAIASELRETLCRYRAALDHYTRHAAAASAALHRFASGLQGRLRAEFERRTYATQSDFDELRRALGVRVDAALGDFNAALRDLQRSVDNEVGTQLPLGSCDQL